MQLRPIIGWESQTCYPSMHSADKLSQYTLQNMCCIKEVEKAQNSGQAVSPKQWTSSRQAVDMLTQQNSCRTRRPAQAEQAATAP